MAILPLTDDLTDLLGRPECSVCGAEIVAPVRGRVAPQCSPDCASEARRRKAAQRVRSWLLGRTDPVVVGVAAWGGSGGGGLPDRAFEPAVTEADYSRLAFSVELLPALHREACHAAREVIPVCTEGGWWPMVRERMTLVRADWLAWCATLVDATEPEAGVCSAPGCSRPLEDMRADALYCGDACRKRSARTRGGESRWPFDRLLDDAADRIATVLGDPYW